MYHLLIDTADWINLCLRYPEVLNKLELLVSTGRVVLILPQTIIDEWNDNRDTEVVESWQKSMRGKAKNAKELLDLLPQQASEELRQSLNTFLNDEQAFNQSILQTVEIVETLFQHPSTITLEIAPDIKLRATDYALEKKAPFGNRNSMADALILFSLIDFTENESPANCIFVSNNTRDFADQGNKEAIHPDLAEMTNELGIQYFSNIGMAINAIEEGLVKLEIVEVIEQTLELEEKMQRLHEALTADTRAFEAWRDTLDAMKPSPEMERLLKDLSLPADSPIHKLVEEDEKLRASFQSFQAKNTAAFEDFERITKPSPEIQQMIEDITLPADSPIQKLMEENAKLRTSVQELYVGDTDAFEALKETMKLSAGLPFQKANKDEEE